MSRTALCIVSLLFICAALQAQGTLKYGQNLRTVLNDRLAEDYDVIDRSLKDFYDTDFEKSPLLFEKWDYAQLEFVDGLVVDSLLINFDDHEGNLLVTLMEGVWPLTVKTRQLKRFTFYHSQDKPYIGKTDRDFEEVDTEFAFYQLLYGDDATDDTTLLRRRIKKYRGLDDEVSYPLLKGDSQFDAFSRYYLRMEGGKYQQINLTKRGFQSVVGKEKINEVKDLLKEKGLRWGDEQALIEVLGRYF